MANPFVAGTNTERTTSSNDLPVFREYAWDFENNQFIFENGQHKIVTENEALKVWIYKTLKTERWQYPIYDNSYGIELEQYIGKRTNNNATAGEIENYITEALLINPYIVSIDDIQYTLIDDKLTYAIQLTTIYGSMVTTSNN